MTRPSPGEYRELLEEHAAEVLDGQAAAAQVLADAVQRVVEPVPALLRIETPEQATRRFSIARLAEKAAEKAKRREEGTRWSSAAKALRDYARHLGDGIDTKAPSSIIARMIDEQRGSEGVISERDEPVYHDQRSAVRFAEVGLALEAAYLVPWTLTTSPKRVEVSVADCRTILVLRTAGERISSVLDRAQKGNRPGERRRNVRGTVWREVPAKTTEMSSGEVVIGVAERLAERLGYEVTVGHVAAIVRHGLREVTRRLSAAGLVPEARRREETDDMSRPELGWDVEGLKAIADVVAMSLTRLREVMAEPEPPPIKKYGERYVAVRAELEAWARARVRSA